MPYQREDYYQPSGIDTGQAEVYSTLSARLMDFSQRAAQQAETMALPRVQAAGAAAAQAGDTKLKAPITRLNRAYNDALVRAYALNKYADIHQEVSRIELEAGTNLEQFRTQVDGYRKGTIPNLMPEAQPLIEEALNQRIAEGAIRVGTLAANEQRANTIAEADRGRQTIEDQVSRLLTSGDPEQIAQAGGLTSFYVNSLKGDMVAGLKSEREANAQIDKFHKNVTQQVALGQLQAELDDPQGDPVKLIEHTLAAASPYLSNDEKTELVSEQFQLLNAHQALASERLQQQTLGMQAQWAAGEQQATQLLVDGKLSIGIVSRMLRDDRLDPAFALTLRTQLKEGNPGISDEKTMTLIGLNVLSYSEDEIMSEPGLSWEDRGKLIKERRDLDDSWRTTQAGKEGADRIDRALGLVPGTAVVMLSDVEKRARGTALNQWYDLVEELPDDQRSNRAILDASAKVIDRVIIRNVALQVERNEKNKRDFIAEQGDPKKMDEYDREEYDRQLKMYDDRIANARAGKK